VWELELDRWPDSWTPWGMPPAGPAVGVPAASGSCSSGRRPWPTAARGSGTLSGTWGSCAQTALRGRALTKGRPKAGKLIFPVTEAAQLLGLSPRTLVRWEKEGRIPPARRDRRIYTAAEVRMLA